MSGDHHLLGTPLLKERELEKQLLVKKQGTTASLPYYSQ